MAAGELKRVDTHRGKRYTLRALASAPPTPPTRGHCLQVGAVIERQLRGCPHLRCIHHLGPVGEEFDETCTLDVVDANPDGMEQEDIGLLLGTSRQRVEQIENGALDELAHQDAPRELFRELAGVSPAAPERRAR